MKEIEVLVEVNSPYKDVIKKLEQFEYVGIQETIDTYFYDPMRENLKPNKKKEINECLRLRTQNDKNYITYKVDHFEDDGKWLYSDEYETKFEDVYTLGKIFDKLGLKELLVIHNTKRIYKYQEYEIIFETVKDLGYFLEVEYCTNEDIDIKEKKKEIQTFIDELELNVSDELTMGKPEMMLRKYNIETD